ncbi:hypothetical protein ABMA75_03065 [Halobacteriovorax sp. ZH4_bin.1]|uniref:hypothetical protein n=1 Tax=unclassified Halobacteriovorax TaxID=2639665 RepID=UPI003722C285
MNKLISIFALFLVQSMCLGAISIADQAMDSVEYQEIRLHEYGDRADLGLRAQGKAKVEGKLFAETKAKQSATKKAKANATYSIKRICDNNERIDFSNSDCYVAGDVAYCSIDAEVECIGVNKKELIIQKVKAGLIDPSPACVDYLKEDYNIDDKVVEYCNKITSEVQFTCMTYATSYSSFKVASIAACSAYVSQSEEEALLGLSVLRNYVGKGELDMKYPAPTTSAVLLTAAINTKEEKNCVENYLKTGTLKVDEVEKSCIQDEPIELDAREYEVFGFVISPRTVEYGFKKPVSDTARGIFDRLGDILGL